MEGRNWIQVKIRLHQLTSNYPLVLFAKDGCGFNGACLEFGQLVLCQKHVHRSAGNPVRIGNGSATVTGYKLPKASPDRKAHRDEGGSKV